MKKILIPLFICLLFVSVGFSADTHIWKFSPKVSGAKQPSAVVNYIINYTLYENCTGVLLNWNQTFTTDTSGERTEEIDISGLTQYPNYYCIYHNASGTLTNITTSNVTSIISENFRILNTTRENEFMQTYNTTYDDLEQNFSTNYASFVEVYNSTYNDMYLNFSNNYSTFIEVFNSTYDDMYWNFSDNYATFTTVYNSTYDNMFLNFSNNYSTFTTTYNATYEAKSDNNNWNSTMDADLDGGSTYDLNNIVNATFTDTMETVNAILTNIYSDALDWFVGGVLHYSFNSTDIDFSHQNVNISIGSNSYIKSPNGCYGDNTTVIGMWSSC